MSVVAIEAAVSDDEERALNSNARGPVRLAYTICVILAVLAPSSARAADFFDDMRQTFQADIPHFFQDDIPCAFGGEPTSGTKASCKAPDHATKAVNGRNDAAVSSDRGNKSAGQPTAKKHRRDVHSDKAKSSASHSAKQAAGKANSQVSQSGNPASGKNYPTSVPSAKTNYVGETRSASEP